MSFWNAWQDPLVEPKRPYRYLVRFPIYNPSRALLERASSPQFSDIYTNNELDGDSYNNRYSTKDGGNLFVFPVTRCTKPAFKAPSRKTKNAHGGWTKTRENQATVYSFTPVELELIDTYDHDLEATLTAMLYSNGNLASPYDRGNAVGGADVIYIHNAPERALIPQPKPNPPLFLPRFEIIELLPAEGMDGSVDAWLTNNKLGRKFTLYNSTVASVTFSALDYREDVNPTTVSLTIDYDTYDYEYMGHHLPPNRNRDEYRVKRYGILKDNFGIQNDELDAAEREIRARQQAAREEAQRQQALVDAEQRRLDAVEAAADQRVDEGMERRRRRQREQLEEQEQQDLEWDLASQAARDERLDAALREGSTPGDSGPTSGDLTNEQVLNQAARDRGLTTGEAHRILDERADAERQEQWTGGASQEEVREVLRLMDLDSDGDGIDDYHDNEPYDDSIN